MYGKCALRLIHHTYPNLNEFRVVVSQVQRCRRLVQDMKSGGGGGRGGGGERSSVGSITRTQVQSQDPFHFVPTF